MDKVLRLFPSTEAAEEIYLALNDKKQKSLDEVVRRIVQIMEKDNPVGFVFPCCRVVLC